MGSVKLDNETMHSDLYLALGLSHLSGSGKGVLEVPRALSLISITLERVVKKNERLLELTEIRRTDSVFNGLRAPNLSLKIYTERIFKYSKCSPSCFVLAHIYIDRFLQQPNIQLTSLNVHRLLVTSVVVAAKFIDDAFFNNTYYARVGGVSTAEMNTLELNFLFSLDFRLSVNLETFGKYCSQLVKEETRYNVERPIQICRSEEWANMEEKCQTTIQKYACGAV